MVSEKAGSWTGRSSMAECSLFSAASLSQDPPHSHPRCDCAEGP